MQSSLHFRHVDQLSLKLLLLLAERRAQDGVELRELPAATTVELQQVRVVLPQCRTMGHGHQRYAHLDGLGVHDAFDIDADSTSTLIL